MDGSSNADSIFAARSHKQERFAGVTIDEKELQRKGVSASLC